MTPVGRREHGWRKQGRRKGDMDANWREVCIWNLVGRGLTKEKGTIGIYKGVLRDFGGVLTKKWGVNTSSGINISGKRKLKGASIRTSLVFTHNSLNSIPKTPYLKMAVMTLMTFKKINLKTNFVSTPPHLLLFFQTVSFSLSPKLLQLFPFFSI